MQADTATQPTNTSRIPPAIHLMPEQKPDPVRSDPPDQKPDPVRSDPPEKKPDDLRNDEPGQMPEPTRFAS